MTNNSNISNIKIVAEMPTGAVTITKREKRDFVATVTEMLHYMNENGSACFNVGTNANNKSKLLKEIKKQAPEVDITQAKDPDGNFWVKLA